MPVNGIDISAWNESYHPLWTRLIDWPAAARDPLSIQFASIKIGEGYWEGYHLPRAIEQFEGAGSVGWLRNWYSYAHPQLPISAQADYDRRRAQGRPGELPFMRDYEQRDPQAAWTHPHPLRTAAEYRAAIADARRFIRWHSDDLKAHDDAFGRLTLAYSGPWYFAWALIVALREGWDISELVKHPLSNADYSGPEDPMPGWPSAIHQYSSSGQVQGFPTRIDLDRFKGSLDELRAWGCGGKAAVTETPTTTTAPAERVRLDGRTWYLAIRATPGGRLTRYYMTRQDTFDIIDKLRDGKGQWWGKVEDGPRRGWIALARTVKVEGARPLAFAYVVEGEGNGIRVV